MSERRIYKYQGTLIGDDRVDSLIKNQFSSSTKTMLENLVSGVDDGTIRLFLDQNSEDQGYISYYPPSQPDAEDDYFSFDSLNYSIALPLNIGGTVVVNGDGKFYNNFIKIISQTTDGDFEVYFTIFDSLDMQNSNKSGMIERLKAIITAANPLSVTGEYNIIQGQEEGNHVITAMSLNANGTLHFTSPTAQQTDSDANWTNAVTVNSIPMF